ncbi:MAG TPA: hypothetical protein VF796_09210 [Humisphaera sp.]
MNPFPHNPALPLADAGGTAESWVPVVLLVIAVMAVPFVIRRRRRGMDEDHVSLATAECCEHLKPALDHVLAAGGRVTRVGQVRKDFPLEIHVDPPFDPQALYDELKLAPPAHVSERNVLYCKEDWCELHPKP